MNYTEFKEMNKKANLAEWLIKGVGGLSEIGTSVAVGLLAAGAGIGGAGGWLAAKMNAKDKQDIATIQKEYENERLKADLGYLSAKTNQELQQAKTKQAPKPARVMA